MLEILGGVVIALSLGCIGLEVITAKRENRRVNRRSILFDLLCIAMVLI